MIAPYSYELLLTWWEKRSFPPIPKEILPSTGYLVKDDLSGLPLLTGFLYIPQGEAKLGMFMWPVSNPEASSLQRACAWIELMDHVDKVAKEAGLWMLWTGTQNKALVSRMETHGYVPIESDSVSLLKQLVV